MSDIIQEIKPVLFLEGRTRRAHLELNADFIRQCHKQNWSLMEIAAAIGMDGKQSTLTAMFVSYKMGRTHMGFPALSGKRRCSGEALADFKARVQKAPEDTIAGLCERNADLIKDIHRADVTVSQMARIFNVSYGSLNVALQKMGLTRKAISLAELDNHEGLLTAELIAARWSPRQDAHIRRGHACGLSPRSIGAVCNRNAHDVERRGRELGLGIWDIEGDARLRLRRVQDYDARHDIKSLEHHGPARNAARSSSLHPDAAYAK